MIIRIDSLTKIRISAISDNEFTSNKEALSRILMDIAYAYMMSETTNTKDGYIATAKAAEKMKKIFMNASKQLDEEIEEELNFEPEIFELD